MVSAGEGVVTAVDVAVVVVRIAAVVFDLVFDLGSDDDDNVDVDVDVDVDVAVDVEAGVTVIDVVVIVVVIVVAAAVLVVRVMVVVADVDNLTVRAGIVGPRQRRSFVHCPISTLKQGSERGTHSHTSSHSLTSWYDQK